MTVYTLSLDDVANVFARFQELRGAGGPVGASVDVPSSDVLAALFGYVAALSLNLDYKVENRASAVSGPSKRARQTLVAPISPCDRMRTCASHGCAQVRKYTKQLKLCFCVCLLVSAGPCLPHSGVFCAPRPPAPTRTIAHRTPPPCPPRVCLLLPGADSVYRISADRRGKIQELIRAIFAQVRLSA